MAANLVNQQVNKVLDELYIKGSGGIYPKEFFNIIMTVYERDNSQWMKLLLKHFYVFLIFILIGKSWFYLFRFDIQDIINKQK